jgi:hypothetical protein
MLAQLTGHYPTRVLLIGCQPEDMMDYGGSLRPSVKAAMEARWMRRCACSTVGRGAAETRARRWRVKRP